METKYVKKIMEYIHTNGTQAKFDFPIFMTFPN